MRSKGVVGAGQEVGEVAEEAETYQYLSHERVIASLGTPAEVGRREGVAATLTPPPPAAAS